MLIISSFDKCVIDLWVEGWTYGPTDKASNKYICFVAVMLAAVVAGTAVVVVAGIAVAVVTVPPLAVARVALSLRYFGYFSLPLKLNLYPYLDATL